MLLTSLAVGLGLTIAPLPQFILYSGPTIFTAQSFQDKSQAIIGEIFCSYLLSRQVLEQLMPFHDPFLNMHFGVPRLGQNIGQPNSSHPPIRQPFLMTVIAQMFIENVRELHFYHQGG